MNFKNWLSCNDCFQAPKTCISSPSMASVDASTDCLLPLLVIWLLSQSRKESQNFERRWWLLSWCDNGNPTEGRTAWSSTLRITRGSLSTTKEKWKVRSLLQFLNWLQLKLLYHFPGSAINGPVAKECADLWPRIASNASAIHWT